MSYRVVGTGVKYWQSTLYSSDSKYFFLSWVQHAVGSPTVKLIHCGCFYSGKQLLILRDTLKNNCQAQPKPKLQLG